MMDEEALMNWFNMLYNERSHSSNILDVLPEYRVTWTEIWAKMQELGYKGNVVDGRMDWKRVCLKNLVD